MTTAAAAGDGSDGEEGTDAYAKLLSAAANLKSLADQLSHKLSVCERFDISRQLSATLNVMLNSSQHHH